MEFLKTNVMRQKYKSFIEEILLAVANCGPCGRFSCKEHRKFTVACNRCREQRYSNCCAVKSYIEILTKSGD